MCMRVFEIIWSYIFQMYDSDGTVTKGSKEKWLKKNAAEWAKEFVENMKRALRVESDSRAVEIRKY